MSHTRPRPAGRPDDPAAALRAQIRRLRAGSAGPHAPARVDLTPGSVYEAITRQMVEALGKDLTEIKGRLNGLLWMVAGAILLDLLIRLAGTG